MLTCRFEESERYDILWDAYVLDCRAITNRGTWHACLHICNSNEKRPTALVRAAKRRFRELAIRSMERGDDPSEILVSLEPDE